MEQLRAAALAVDVAEARRGLKLYRDAEVRWDQQAEIRSRFGYGDFSEPGVRLGLLRWLYTWAWVTAERRSRVLRTDRHHWASAGGDLQARRRSRRVGHGKGDRERPAVHEVEEVPKDLYEDSFQLFNSMISPWHEWMDPVVYNRHVDTVEALRPAVVASAHGHVLRGGDIHDAFDRVRTLAGQPRIAPPGQSLLDELLTSVIAA